MTAILQTYQLSKQYGAFQAVQNVTFEIQAGEIFSLLGPNGAGKTTTLSMLCGLIPPTSGEAQVNGASVVRQPQQVKRQIGVVPQDIALYGSLSGRENLLFWGRMYDLNGAALQQRVAEVLEQVGLTDKANQRVDTYSGGMKRRINIGVGLLHRPALLFMDEPTVGIDPQSRRNILDAVKSLNQAGMTVLYTTHYMEEAQELSDRVGILDHGQLIAVGTQAELTERVGQHGVLRVAWEPGPIPEEVAARLTQIAGIEQAGVEGSRATLVVKDPAQALAPVVSTLDGLGVKIRSLEVQEPNLEAVFLHLTGRALRD